MIHLWQWAEHLLNDGSFLGALLGAILSGIIAIIVLMKGIKHQNNLITKTEIGNFLREATYLSDSVTSLEMFVKEYIKHQRQEENSPLQRDEIGNEISEASEIKVFKEMNGRLIKNTLSKIQSVDRKAFNYKAFDVYLDIINICERDIEFFWDSSMNDRIGVADILDEYNSKLSELNQQLIKLIQQEKKRINKL